MILMLHLQMISIINASFICNNTAPYDLYLEICKLITNTNNILKINSMYKEYLLR